MVLPCAAAGFWAAVGLQLSIEDYSNIYFPVRGRILARTIEHLHCFFANCKSVTGE